MAEERIVTEKDIAADEGVAESLAVSAVEPRIYEVGYHIVPTVKEEELEKIIGGIRSVIEREGGAFIAESAPASTRLSYAMKALAGAGDKRIFYDRSFFGWIKFEANAGIVDVLERTLKTDPDFLRVLVWKTVREDTRAKIKAPTLREVKRTDTIKAAPRRAPTEESKGPVSEADLEKALKEITEV